MMNREQEMILMALERALDCVKSIMTVTAAVVLAGLRSVTRPGPRASLP
jgi:hypothetical protein